MVLEKSRLEDKKTMAMLLFFKGELSKKRIQQSTC